MSYASKWYGGTVHSGASGGRPVWTESWRPVDDTKSLADGVNEIASLKPDVLGVFHSRIAESTRALEVVLDEWSGPVIVYPDAGREDYLATWQDRSVSNEESVEELTREAETWVDMGAQVVGTCCGFGVDYTRSLRDALPAGTSSSRRVAGHAHNHGNRT